MTRMAVTAFVFVLAGFTALPARAEPVPRTLTVSGTGIATAVPDEASFSTGVVSQAPTAAAALSANTRAMAAVVATLKRQGVADKAIQTSNVALSPQYQSCKPNVDCPQKIVGYEVANTVTVTVGLDKAGAALDALVAAGANRIDGIAFAVHDAKPLFAVARTEAVKEAIAKAEAYARAAGVSLGPIQSIGEGGDGAPMPVNALMGYRAKAGAVPIEAGEAKFAATVSITWTIQ
jgi:uncharacterized protein